jgi:heme-degrading monooxygenase HmoA
MFEIDTVRISLAEALERFRAVVLPRLRQQPGFQGVRVMHNPDGRGLLVSLWETEAAAQATIESGFYDEQVAEFVTVMRQPPGRDHYEVVYTEEPPLTSAPEAAAQHR